MIKKKLITKLKKISIDEAKELVKENDIISAVGHDAAAEVISEILGIKVKTNRIEAKQKQKQKCICFKLKGRLPEGKILSRKDIEKIGFDFFLLERL